MDKLTKEAAHGRARQFRYALVAAVLIAVGDLVSKWFVATVVMDPPRRIPILPFFDLVITFNRGVSFGLLGDLGSWGPALLSALAAGIMVLLLVWLHHTSCRNEAIALAMILGGAAGNLVDRLHDDAVTDFLDLYAGTYHWPAFNGADGFITIGAMWLFAASFGARKSDARISTLGK